MPTVIKTGDKISVSFQGDLDTVTCISFEEELFETINKNVSKLVFDLDNVNSTSSMFLRICAKTTQKIGKDNFSIVNVHEPVMKIFKLTNMDSFINISK